MPKTWIVTSWPSPWPLWGSTKGCGEGAVAHDCPRAPEGILWTSRLFPPKPHSQAPGCACRREKHLFLTCTSLPIASQRPWVLVSPKVERTGQQEEQPGTGSQWHQALSYSEIKTLTPLGVFSSPRNFNYENDHVLKKVSFCARRGRTRFLSSPYC